MPPSVPTGLYLHIPFCHARCGYCDFVTFTGKEAQIDRFVDALLAELRLNGRAFTVPGGLASIFFGGGTPSVLEGRQVERILQEAGVHWDLSKAEITLEANPESVTLEKARAWRRAGVNRVSIGLQSFDEALLKVMGRLHSAAEFVRAYESLREAGFANLNVDLIYGFEGQSMAVWRETLRRAIALAPEHLSLYGLTIEPHTPFAAAGHRIDADTQADQYDEARRELRGAGYEQYEVSNFSKPGFACRHNLLYWRQEDYIGAGVGAVGCVGGRRWQVAKNLPGYFQAIEAGTRPWESVEDLPAAAQRFERLMLGLRLREGLAWGEEENAAWRQERARLAREGLLEEVRPGVWRIPERAIALTNQILLPFV